MKKRLDDMSLGDLFLNKRLRIVFELEDDMFVVILPPRQKDIPLLFLGEQVEKPVQHLASISDVFYKVLCEGRVCWIRETKGSREKYEVL